MSGVELMVTYVPILQIYQSCTVGSSDVMEVRWLNSVKKTAVLTWNKIRLKALFSFKCLVMYFKISLRCKFNLEKSGKFK